LSVNNKNEHLSKTKLLRGGAKDTKKFKAGCMALQIIDFKGKVNNTIIE